MNPVNFKGVNIIFGKNQPEYLPLPAVLLENGHAITCWELSDEELQEVIKTRKIYINQLTFNTPMQPIRPSANLDELIEINLDFK